MGGTAGSFPQAGSGHSPEAFEVPVLVGPRPAAFGDTTAGTALLNHQHLHTARRESFLVSLQPMNRVVCFVFLLFLTPHSKTSNSILLKNSHSLLGIQAVLVMNSVLGRYVSVKDRDIS